MARVYAGACACGERVASVCWRAVAQRLVRARVRFVRELAVLARALVALCVVIAARQHCFCGRTQRVSLFPSLRDHTPTGASSSSLF
eukprot:5391487-Pleurochrysis_carterae.AAC.1